MMAVGMTRTRLGAHARGVSVAAVAWRVGSEAVLDGSGHVVRLELLEGRVGRGHDGRGGGLGAAIGCV